MTSIVKICCRFASSLPAARSGLRTISISDITSRPKYPHLHHIKNLSTADSESTAKSSTEEQPNLKHNVKNSTEAQPDLEQVEPTNDDRLNELTESNEKLSQKVKEIEDKYVRSLAETENVRQRMKKQIDDAKQFGIQQFCKDLLTVADTLRLATDNISAEQLENDVVKNMHEGLKLTESQLLQVFKKHGVERSEPEGERFDPNLHEAVFQQPMPEKEPGTIFVVTKSGYTLNSRVLRPALVGVVKGP